MLVLTRRLAETLRIGDDIEVTVIGVSGNQVRLAIAAPRDVAVDREEIHERKQAGIPKPLSAAKDDAHKPAAPRVSRAEIRSRLFGPNHESPR